MKNLKGEIENAVSEILLLNTLKLCCGAKCPDVMIVVNFKYMIYGSYNYIISPIRELLWEPLWWKIMSVAHKIDDYNKNLRYE